MQQLQSRRPRFRRMLFLVLLVLVSLALYTLYRIATRPSGYSFDQSEAFHLAQECQDWRSHHSSPGNYGRPSITIFYDDGSQRRFAPGHGRCFEGFDDQYGENSTHSEIQSHNWVKDELAGLKKAGYIDQHTTGVAVVVFSQVIVCRLCRAEMRGWLREFRTEAGTDTLTVTIWQLTRGYNPVRVPRGRPVTSEADVSRVPITFDLSNPP